MVLRVVYFSVSEHREEPGTTPFSKCLLHACSLGGWGLASPSNFYVCICISYQFCFSGEPCVLHTLHFSRQKRRYPPSCFLASSPLAVVYTRIHGAGASTLWADMDERTGAGISCSAPLEVRLSPRILGNVDSAILWPFTGLCLCITWLV